MQESLLRGNTSRLPFAKLLLALFQEEESGYLRIKKDKLDKNLYLEKGEIAAVRSLLPEKDFLKALVEKNLLDKKSLSRSESFASQNKSNLTKALLELDIFSPSELWKLMKEFLKADILPLFDWSDGEYTFDPENIPKGSDILFRLPTLNFILQGIRAMENHEIIQAHIPQENSAVSVVRPCSLNPNELEPPEHYLLKIIEKNNDLKTIYESSELGRKETQKILFSLITLGLVASPQQPSKEKMPDKSTQAELAKILEAFNSKCTHIYKYISKEIGPVALNVLEKCQQEIRGHLSSASQKIKLRPDGGIDMNSLLKTSLWSEEQKKNLIKDLNEILAAEVLAVKKNLGNAHESALVKNLEKIGEWN